MTDNLCDIGLALHNAWVSLLGHGVEREKIYAACKAYFQHKQRCGKCNGRH